jgi:predicted small lipoprotein YifL
MKPTRILAALLIALALTACGQKEAPPPPAAAKPTDAELRAERLAKSAENQKLENMLEQNRSTAMANIERNLAGYFAINPRFQPAKDWTTIPHTDDYIDAACPQGSGWGWANIMNTKLLDEKGQPTKHKVFCSTTSASLGCYIENDFKTGPHNKQYGRCNENLPSPLKPISR